MELKKNNWFNISNSLSFLRILFVFPTIYLFSFQKNGWVFIIAFLAMLSDYLDGYLARRLNQITDLGKILDPIADKILIGSAVISLTVYQDFPLWITIVIVLRDLFIFLGAMFIYDRQRHVTQSNWPGKVTVTIIAVTVLAFMAGFMTIFNYLAYLTFIAIIVSASMYANIFFQKLNEE